MSDVYDEAQLSEHFRGKDVVVNLVGILNERGFGGGGFRRAHTELTRAVLQAMRSAGVPRLLQVSALKAATDAPSYYLRSKGEAEKLIRESGVNLDWTIFQPSVMFGHGDSFLNRFATLLASVPFAFPLARPNARFQPVLQSTMSSRRCGNAACAAVPAPVKPMNWAVPGSIRCARSSSWRRNSRAVAAGSSVYPTSRRGCRVSS